MTTSGAADPGARLRALLPGAPVADVLALFDALPAMTVDGMIGSWRGHGIDTGNRLDGLLERFGWHGKRFDGADQAHPLLFDDGRGGVTAIDPSLVPLSVVVRCAALLRNPVAAAAFRLARPLLRTSRPRARLRMTEYRGVVSATMCYDSLPVHDVFRQVDGDTVLAVMDMRGLDPPFVFVLHRDRRGRR
jgi:hypothetical protein